jgi:hypothetical protein
MIDTYPNRDCVIVRPMPGHPVGAKRSPSKDQFKAWVNTGYATPDPDTNQLPGTAKPRKARKTKATRAA